MNGIKESQQFGKNTGTITISKNGKAREYRVPLGVFVGVSAAFVMLMAGYLAATAFLMFSDDLVASSLLSQARMKHEYEDRIAALRTKVDRITSRQLLDQQAVESKVAALMRQQELLSNRSGEIKDLMRRAGENGLSTPVIPTPNPRGDEGNGLLGGDIRTGSIEISNGVQFAGVVLRGSSGVAIPGQVAKPARNRAIATQPVKHTINGYDVAAVKLVEGISRRIGAIEAAQMTDLQVLARSASQKASKLASVYEDLSVPAPIGIPENIGGPFLPAGATQFDDLAANLTASLDTIAALKKGAKALPIGEPVKGARISSRFGNRVDPFFKRSAFHAGIDYKANSGTPVTASGAGVVVKAGRNGGYGLMVEIDHGNGIASRYAHLSRILVKKGHRVAAGKQIGRVGSTGRSTGPHLHYEVRRAGKAINPARFLKAGRNLARLL